MRQIFIVLAAMAAVGSLAGWLSAGGGANGFRTGDASWSLPARPLTGETERVKLYTELMATNHFGAERSSMQSDETGDEEVASAPRIAATWIKDGQIALSFDTDEEKLATASIGDTLPGGWIIKDATLDHVTLERDGKITEIKVFPYEKPGI